MQVSRGGWFVPLMAALGIACTLPQAPRPAADPPPSQGTAKPIPPEVKGTGESNAARTFLLSAGAVQNWPGEEPFSQMTHPPDYTFNDLARDVDVLGVFVEHYGLPWDELAASDRPPANHNWTVKMTQMAAAARATGKPISLQMVLARDRTAGKALQKAGGAIEVNSDWAGRCYNFRSHANFATAYVRYVTWMVQTFQPRYVNVAVEIDKAYTACGRGATWDGLVELERRAYDAAKAAKPDAIVYFSANAEDLYKQSLTGFDSGLYGALANLKRDRFGLSTYPSGLKRPDGRGAMPNDLPSDYFTRVRKMNPAEAPVVIAETGWNSRDLKVGPGGACVVVADSNEVVQDDYLWVLLQSAETQGIELVTWWSHRDLLPEAVMESCYPLAPPPTFSGCANDSWCLGVNIYRRIAPTNPAFGDVVFKGFGSMGLFDREGRSKAGASRWRATTARSVSP